MVHIGAKLKAIIEDNHLQKNHVALRANITPTYLSRIFEKESIDCKLLDNLCKTIGVSPAIFFDDPTATANVMKDIHAQALLGSVVNISQGEAAALRQLLDEKERTIQILLQALGKGTATGHQQ